MRFKKGDRVRLLDDTSMAAKAGATAKVIGFNGPWVRVEWDRDERAGSQMNGGYNPSSFELVPAATAASTFKVGDRVRFKADYTLATVRGVEATVEAVTDWGVRINAGEPHGISTEQPNSIELSDWDFDPRKLKIEAGKFYKTRDGRKVGPMRLSDWEDVHRKRQARGCAPAPADRAHSSQEGCGMNNTNWPAFWRGFFDGWAAAAIIFAAFAWLVILPTVGLLYSFGVLP